MKNILSNPSLKITPLIVGIAILVITIFLIENSISLSQIDHHQEIRLPIPDDNFNIKGVRWEWNNYAYDVGEKIQFTVSRDTENCGDVFTAQIMNPDHTKVFWQESIQSQCTINDDGVVVMADFPTDDSIVISEEGLYVLQVESRDRGYGLLEGQFVVKSKT